jgi:TonB-dependent SusC/RagA subfamily outer membrane receptor
MLQLSAQKSGKKITLTGTVLDSLKNPVTNAMVIVDGENTQVVTDSKGEFKVKIKPAASRIGIFSLIYGVCEEDIAGRIHIDFNYNVASETRPGNEKTADKIVNTGYTNVKDKNLTTTVNKVDGTRKTRTYTSINDMLLQVPGVQMRGGRIVIQDSKDFLGDVYPLMIVDGVPTEDINSVSPDNVASVDVLKGSAAAIYGSRGYGGVILITTKSYQKSNQKK